MYQSSKIVIALMVLVGCQQDRSIEPVDQILDRFVEVSGGKEAIESITTRIVEGTWQDDRPYRGDEKTSPFTLWAHKDGRWRYDSEYESYGVDSIGGWWMEKGLVREDSTQLRSRIAFIFVPQSVLSIADYFDIRGIGKISDIGDRPATSLKTDRDETYYALWFDNKSGTLVQIGNYWMLKDYLLIDGLHIPQLVEESRKGGRIVLEVKSVIHNQDIPDSQLRRPQVVMGTRLP